MLEFDSIKLQFGLFLKVIFCVNIVNIGLCASTLGALWPFALEGVTGKAKQAFPGINICALFNFSLFNYIC